MKNDQRIAPLVHEYIDEKDSLRHSLESEERRFKPNYGMIQANFSLHSVFGIALQRARNLE